MTEAPVRDLGAALAGASEAAGEAGLAFRASGAARLRSAKTGGELLTERDLAADRVLRARLSRAFPEWGILSEGERGHRSRRGAVGSRPARRDDELRPRLSVLLRLRRAPGAGGVGPGRRPRSEPRRDVRRRGGSAALDLAWLAAGRLDGFWAWRTKLWDTAAGVVLVREAGGSVTTFAGTPWRGEEDLVASNGLVHRELLELLEAVAKGS